MNQRTRLLVLGGLGGVVGSVLAEMHSESTGSGDQTLLEVVFNVAVWLALISPPIAFGIRWAIARNCNHRFPTIPQSLAAVVLGAVAGAASGAIAQIAFGSFEEGWFKDFVGRTLCWGIAGAFLGFALSFAIPNLSRWRGSLFGGLGGLVGGGVFLILGEVGLPGSVMRVAGIAAIGTLLGLAVSVAESIELRKGASLEVSYGPKETVRLALGSVPVTFGGTAADTVYVSGLRRAAVSVFLQGDTVQARQGDSAAVPLKDRSAIQIGTVTVTVRVA